MLKGMGTNLFPEEGNIWRAFLGIAPVEPVVELGQLLEAAKNYTESQTGADLTTDTGAQGTNLEYNDFGDPSMAIWCYAALIYAKLLTSVSGAVLKVSIAQPAAEGTLVNVTLNGDDRAQPRRFREQQRRFDTSSAEADLIGRTSAGTDGRTALLRPVEVARPNWNLDSAPAADTFG